MHVVRYVFNTAKWLRTPDLHAVMRCAKAEQPAALVEYQRQHDGNDNAHTPRLVKVGSLPVKPSSGDEVSVSDVVFVVARVKLSDSSGIIDLEVLPSSFLWAHELPGKLSELADNGWSPI